MARGQVIKFFNLLLFVILSGLLCGTVYAGKSKASSKAGPNLLVITFDTTRADRLGCYGYDHVRTPAIDRLASEGVLFTQAYAQSPQTLPSHCSLFTGLYTITHNVLSNGQELSEEAVTLAEILEARGYQTGAIVATAPLYKDFNLDQGFDTYNDDFKQRPPDRVFKAFLKFITVKKVNMRATRPANRVAVLAKKWLKKAGKKDKPFFLWIHFIDPHWPYRYRPNFDKPKSFSEEGELNRYGQKELNYINEIEFADYHLGNVLEKMDKLGLTENTLTIFTADHGESLGEHDYRGHRQEVYNNIIHVPLILRFPGRIPGGKRLDAPAMLIDVVPTILNQLRIPHSPTTFQGEDLFDIPEDRARKIYSLAVKLFTKTPVRKAIVYGDKKYIEHEDMTKHALYNLAKDPGELKNLLEAEPSDRQALNWEAEIRG
ncbi:sulfatase, partial [Acidobacteriota bacterium]